MLADGVALAAPRGSAVIPVLAASAAACDSKQSNCTSPAKMQTLASCEMVEKPDSAVVGAAAVSSHPYVAPSGSAMQCRSAARCSIVLSESPGIWISIVLPDSVMSGSPTPKASTRLRMFSKARFIVSVGVSPGADRMTETPPCRSSPSSGRNRSVANAAIDTDINSPITMIEIQRPRVRFTPTPAHSRTVGSAHRSPWRRGGTSASCQGRSRSTP